MEVSLKQLPTVINNNGGVAQNRFHCNVMMLHHIVFYNIEYENNLRSIKLVSEMAVNGRGPYKVVVC